MYIGILGSYSKSCVYITFFQERNVCFVICTFIKKGSLKFKKMLTLILFVLSYNSLCIFLSYM